MRRYVTLSVPGFIQFGSNDSGARDRWENNNNDNNKKQK